jgi:ABC-type nitrate/sulfonate/bicarbonate transport system substrate-binding protein
MKFRSRIISAVSVTLTGLVLAACGSSGSSSSPPAAAGGGSAKPLSLTNITINGGAGSDSLFTYIADKAGYYKAAGLNVTLDDQVSPGSAVLIAGLVGNSYQFLESTAAQGVITAQSSGSVRAVMTTDVGQQQVIVLPKSLATSLGVPLTAATPQDSVAQLMKLKGSHVKVALTTVTSQIYSDLVAVCVTHGLTCKANDSSADIDIDPVGTNQAMSAAFSAGRVPAIAGIESGAVSQVESDDTVAINLGNISPVSDATGLYLLTTSGMISAHPDTVQAVVTATTKAWQLAHSNTAAAKQYFTQFAAINGVTKPAQVEKAYEDLAKYWTTPLLSEDAYNNVVNIINLSGSSKEKVTVPYATFAEPSYAAQAVKALGLTLPSAS